MSHTYRLVVEKGPDMGSEFPMPERGAGLGRASTNDITLKDEQLSRMHCRFQFRKGDLWVLDLASANGTLVDGQEVEEKRLEHGSRVQIGDTILRLDQDGLPPVPAPAAPPVSATVAVDSPSSPVIRISESESEKKVHSGAAVDLGLKDPEGAVVPMERNIKRTLLWSISTFVALLAAALLVMRFLEAPAPAPSLRPLASAEAPRTLEMRFEKIEGTSENIFRYDLVLDAAGKLSVSIDDISQSRHVRRESPTAVSEELLRQLGRQIEDAGFFALDPVYEGVGLPNTLVSYDLTVILGPVVHRVRVVNRNEPDVFQHVRERIETFVRNELGLWAAEFSKERLESMAHDAYLLGVKLVQEKDIQIGNLHNAMRSFRECANLLETVEPKPEFFGRSLAALRDAGEELERRYTEQNFRADRAIKLKDWEIAAAELRVLLELIPDRADDRYRDAEHRLLDVESRLKNRRTR